MEPQELFDALAAGDAGTVGRLVNAKPELAGARNADGVTARLFALYLGQRALAEELAGLGPELDAFEAAAFDRVDRLGAFIDSLGAVSADGFTALHLACFFGSEDAARFLIARGVPVDVPAANPMAVRPLHSAAASGSVDLVRALLEAGADPNAAQAGGVTALHTAAHRGDLEMARALLAAGARRDATMDGGKSPLDMAREIDAGPELLRELGG